MDRSYRGQKTKHFTCVRACHIHHCWQTYFFMMLRETYDLDMTEVNRACLPSLAQ